MSLDEGLNVNLEETAADGNQNQIAVPRNQSVRPIYEEQLAADGHRRTFSLPGENSCSKWVNQNAFRKDVNAESGEGRSKRSRNLTPKGLAYKCNILQERRRRVSGRLIRKYATIEDLLFSARNLVAVQEEMAQFIDLLKMLLIAHEEYNALSEDEMRDKENEWFDEIDNQVFSFKRKITCWLKKAEEEKSQKFYLEAAETQHQKHQRDQIH